ncbi:Small ubiquitin-related modifier 2-A [Taenia crassiceps]|uniref:Small ubiquitin-related modifier 2-A n=1 Tax=Taenia crassiceps TaxID=6207 RepID=A0ABR4QNP0_9CEST
MGDDNAPKEKNNEPINLTVHGQDGSVIHFKIKRTTPFKKLMNAYCQRLGLTLANVRFTCDGEHVQYEDTPESRFSRLKLVEIEKHLHYLVGSAFLIRLLASAPIRFGEQGGARDLTVSIAVRPSWWTCLAHPRAALDAHARRQAIGQLWTNGFTSA